MPTSLTGRILSALFPRAIHNIATTSAFDAVEKERALVSHVRSHQRAYEVKSWLGKKVIIITNEWEDPIFGTVIFYPEKGVEDLIAIQNALSPNTFPIFISPSSVILADDYMVEAILKLNPFERWNIRNRSGMNMWSKGYPLGSITDSETLKGKLQEAGFYTPVAYKFHI